MTSGDRRPGDAGPVDTVGAFPVRGMTCASCVARVEDALRRVPGVASAAVNLAAEEAVIRYDGGPATVAAVREAVRTAGYELLAALPDPAEEAAADAGLRRDLRVSAGLTIPITFLSMYSMVPGLPPLPLDAGSVNLLLLLLTIPLILGPGARFFRTLPGAIRTRSADMNTLVALGSGAAFLYSAAVTIVPPLQTSSGVPHVYFDTGAMIVTLVLFGRTLESRARRRTGEAMRGLLALQPGSARVRRDGRETDLSVDAVVPGDVFIVRPGERIAVDGEVIAGMSAVDESALTGESMPRVRRPGDGVLGGSLNTDGTLDVRATAVGSAGVLGRIIRIVRATQGSKPAVQRLADRIAAVFVPAVLFIALGTVAGWLFAGTADVPEALLAGIAVLLIACPCALGLATPTALMVGTGTAARAGILVRTIEALEHLAAVRLLVVDKTGTLTRGTPSLTRITPLGEGDPDDLLRLAASVESRSTHPVARAIHRAAEERRLPLGVPEEFRSFAGRGVAGRVDGRFVAVGGEALLEELGIPGGEAAVLAGRSQQEGETAAFIAVDGSVRAVVAVADTLRPESPAVIRRLRDLGMRIILLTGDREDVARRIAAAAGIDEVRAGVLPDEKAAFVRRLRESGGAVALLGDGVNDAPALAVADVGLAMGSGADVAMESADITLLRQDLAAVPETVLLARRTMRVIRQNLFWAFLYNIIGIPLAAMAVLNPMLAAAAMAISSVTVVGNSLRLRRAIPPRSA